MFGICSYLYSNPILSNLEELPSDTVLVLRVASSDIRETIELLELARELGVAGILLGSLLFIIGAVLYQSGSAKRILSDGGWVDLVVGIIVLVGAFLLGYAPANSTMQDYHTLEGIARGIIRGGSAEEYARALEIRAISGALMGFGLIGILFGLQDLLKDGRCSDS